LTRAPREPRRAKTTPPSSADTTAPMGSPSAPEGRGRSCSLFVEGLKPAPRARRAWQAPESRPGSFGFGESEPRKIAEEALRGREQPFRAARPVPCTLLEQPCARASRTTPEARRASLRVRPLYPHAPQPGAQIGRAGKKRKARGPEPDLAAATERLASATASAGGARPGHQRRRVEVSSWLPDVSGRTRFPDAPWMRR
jgi:hypothetical protein